MPRSAGSPCWRLPCQGPVAAPNFPLLARVGAMPWYVAHLDTLEEMLLLQERCDLQTGCSDVTNKMVLASRPRIPFIVSNVRPLGDAEHQSLRRLRRSHDSGMRYCQSGSAAGR